MKKTFTILAAIVAVATFTNCERCATCTFNDETQGTLTEEFCNNGHQYDSALEAYEDNGWSCSED